MIIVSQDKSEIINFNNIGKIYVSEKNTVICTDNQGCFLTRLGIFDTEERAKEVLQEIINKYSEYGVDECSAVTVFPKVYIMPEE